MNIPDKIKVGPFTFHVKHSKHLDCLGETFCDDLVIKIQKGLPTEVAEETFLHELFHAVNHVYCNRSLDESEIRQMSIGVYQVLKENNIF